MTAKRTWSVWAGLFVLCRDILSTLLVNASCGSVSNFRGRTWMGIGRAEPAKPSHPRLTVPQLAEFTRTKRLTAFLCGVERQYLDRETCLVCMGKRLFVLCRDILPTPHMNASRGFVSNFRGRTWMGRGGHSTPSHCPSTHGVYENETTDDVASIAVSKAIS